MATIKINGNVFEVPDGASVVVNGTTISVGGRMLADGLGQTTHVEWTGPVGSLDCQSCTIHGNVSGDVKSQSVNCRDVGGSVKSQTVNCGTVGGDVNAMVVNRR